ncbi:hypothetical protein KZZ20_01715 [Methylacidiphilum fumariolicum]|nr:hypothetical protein [Candidatus Methylacidiphilum fumarolicum]MBW6414247.1 hypothetical protein [Candidatus Methylacidiphilum fumarolicum]
MNGQIPLLRRKRCQEVPFDPSLLSYALFSVCANIKKKTRGYGESW